MTVDHFLSLYIQIQSEMCISLPLCNMLFLWWIFEVLLCMYVYRASQRKYKYRATNIFKKYKLNFFSLKNIW